MVKIAENWYVLLNSAVPTDRGAAAQARAVLPLLAMASKGAPSM